MPIQVNKRFDKENLSPCSFYTILYLSQFVYVILFIFLYLFPIFFTLIFYILVFQQFIQLEHSIIVPVVYPHFYTTIFYYPFLSIFARNLSIYHIHIFSFYTFFFFTAYSLYNFMHITFFILVFYHHIFLPQYSYSHSSVKSRCLPLTLLHLFWSITNLQYITLEP